MSSLTVIKLAKIMLWAVRVLVIALVGTLTFMGADSFAQENAVVPDFSGEWARPGGLFDFPPPPAGIGPGPLVNTSGNRLVPVANYDSPLLKPWAAEAVKEHGDTLLAGRLAPDAHSSCRPMGVPYVLQVRGNVRFLQTPEWIVITYEDDNQRRLVHLNTKHSSQPTPTWMGESIGHYEGNDTLVIDTIGIAEHGVSVIDRFGTPHTEGLHVIERYRIAEDEEGEKILQVGITIDDPNTFNMAWHASSIYGVGGEHEEDICAENIRGFHGPSEIVIPTDLKADF